ncbi:MAG: glycosyltransferase family 9 protein [Thiovulaceae bacterium]|jgi:ADP-heptose:LPS heptosyltransferase|nr:glycosyltransferase family 9 protein [Sulfurimonadaceae bacterium]
MRILVVRNDKLGDFITALPTLYVLKHHNPENTIVACVAPLNKQLALACDFIDEVIVDEPKSSVFALAQKLRHAKIDISVTLFSNTRVALAQFLARIPKRIAPATKIAQIFYTRRIRQRRSEVKMAEFEYNLALAKEVFGNIDLAYPKPLLRFEDAAQIYADFVKQHAITKEVVAFHVGFGGSSDANWSLEEYVVLIDEVLQKGRYDVVLTFGPDEKALYETMQEKLRGRKAVFYVSQEGLVAFAKLISGFAYFVSTSTGTYHLASLVGTRTITFFADTLFASAARWKSIGDVTLQEHFMIPHAKEERANIFQNVQKKLRDL